MTKTAKPASVVEALEAAIESPAGLVVTAFPTRNGSVCARLDVDGHGVYTNDYDNLAELFAMLSQSATRARKNVVATRSA
jgi:hypothetical protein